MLFSFVDCPWCLLAKERLQAVEAAGAVGPVVVFYVYSNTKLERIFLLLLSSIFSNLFLASNVFSNFSKTVEKQFSKKFNKFRCEI